MENRPIDRRAHPPGAAFSLWHAPDGWEIRRMEWLQPAGEAARGSLLFAGGRADFIEKYLEPLAHWHGRGWNVASFDWRGQGGSRGSIAGGNVDSFAPFVEDLEAFLREWRERSPGPHVAVGHSMGGHLLLRLIVEQAPPLDAAVLVAPMIAVNTTPLPARLAEALVNGACALGLGRFRLWRGTEAVGSGRRRFLTSCRERYSDELWWRSRHPDYGLGAPSWGWLKAGIESARCFAPEQLAKVSTPILILGTERDRLVSPSAIRRVATALPGAELLMFPDAAHEILRERDAIREAALSRIDGFLEEHARR